MSEALVSSLNDRIAELTKHKAQLSQALKQARAERKAATEERDGLKADLQSLVADRDTWKGKAEAAPTEQAARIAELEQQLSGRDHRDAFRAAALAAGVSPPMVDDLYALSGLKPGTEPATPEGFAEFLSQAKTARAWAFGASAAPPSGQNGTAPPPGQRGNGLAATLPPSGAGRSASSAPTSGVRYTSDDVRRPGWQQARPELVEALKTGTAIFVE